MELPIEFKQRYLSRRSKDLELSWEALKNGEFEILEKIGHQIKGNADTFGYFDLSQLGAKLENAASTRNSNQIEILLSEFSTWLKTDLS